MEIKPFSENKHVHTVNYHIKLSVICMFLSLACPVFADQYDTDKILTLMLGTGNSMYLYFGEEATTQALYNGILSFNSPPIPIGKNSQLFLDELSYYEQTQKLVILPEGILDYVANQKHSISMSLITYLKNTVITTNFSGAVDTYLNDSADTWPSGLFNNSNYEASISLEKYLKKAVVSEDRTITEEIEFTDPETTIKQKHKLDFTLSKGRKTPLKTEYGFIYGYYNFNNTLNISEYFNIGFTKPDSYNYYQYRLYAGREHSFSSLISGAEMWKWQKKRAKEAKNKSDELSRTIKKLKEKREKSKEPEKTEINSQIGKCEEAISALNKEFMSDYSSKSQSIISRLETTKFNFSYYYYIDYLSYPYQNIVSATGEFYDYLRNDLKNTLKLSTRYFFIPEKASFSLESSVLLNLSNQNYYNTRDNAYIPSYYHYSQYSLSAGIKTSFKKPFIPDLSINYTLQYTDYFQRYLQYYYYDLFFSALNTTIHSIDIRAELPITKNFFISLAGSNEIFSAAMGDRRLYPEEGIEQIIKYNFNISLRNYYLFAGLKF